MADFQRACLELEGLWRCNVSAAQGHYSDAVAKHRQALEERQRSPRPARPNAVSKASRAESAARREYIRILESFKEFVFEGNCYQPAWVALLRG
jgi:hypothetical protein